MIKYIENIYKGTNPKDIIKIGSDFEKIAYEMADPVKEYIETLKPDSKSDYLWVNAMGAGETYGSNSRGDYFPRQELINNHHTFTQNPAHVYVQHVNKDPNISLGEVVFSYFNPDTDRVELIQKVDHEKVAKHAPDWVKSGLTRFDIDPLNTSMGTKVAYDECSKCGQKNKTIFDYCDHLKYAMNQWQDGIHIHAINVEPNFFDNSFVRRGADRVARVISKVASYQSSETILTDKELILPKKKFYVPSNYKFASINEQNIDVFQYNNPELSKNQLDELSKHDLNELLGSLKVAECELLPQEFQYLLLCATGHKKHAEDFYERGERFVLPALDTMTTKMSLNTNSILLEDLAPIVCDKTLSLPFVLYRSLHKTAQEMSNFLDKNWVATRNPLLDEIGPLYVSYVNMEKTADFKTFLFSLFFNWDDIKKRQDSKRKIDSVRNKEQTAINQEASKVPTLPVGSYNPVFKSEFLQKNAGLTTKALKKSTPYLIGGGATLYMAGEDAKKELSGDPTAGTGLAGTARKHPIAATLGGGALALTASHGLKKLFKKASLKSPEKIDKDFINEYKEFLADKSPEDLLVMLDRIPEDIISQIICL